MTDNDWTEIERDPEVSPMSDPDDDEGTIDGGDNRGRPGHRKVAIKRVARKKTAPRKAVKKAAPRKAAAKKLATKKAVKKAAPKKAVKMAAKKS